MTTEEVPYKIGVHMTHCCPKHGCKYGDDDCPVKAGKVVVRYPPNNGCEQCEWEEEEFPQIRHYEYMTEVLEFFQKNDITEDLMWHKEGEFIVFSAQCSDVFHYASADSEPIRLGDIPLLRQCIKDLQETGVDVAIVYTAELYAARKRGMRPMRLWLSEALRGPRNKRIYELFTAAGPERTREDEG